MEDEFNFEGLNDFILEKMNDYEENNNEDYRAGALDALTDVYAKFTSMANDYLKNIDEKPSVEEPPGVVVKMEGEDEQ